MFRDDMILYSNIRIIAVALVDAAHPSLL